MRHQRQRSSKEVVIPPPPPPPTPRHRPLSSFFYFFFFFFFFFVTVAFKLRSSCRSFLLNNSTNKSKKTKKTKKNQKEHGACLLCLGLTQVVTWPFNTQRNVATFHLTQFGSIDRLSANSIRLCPFCIGYSRRIINEL